MSIPYIYKKIAHQLKLNGNGKMKANEAKSELSKVRITNSDFKHIVKDLEKHGLVTLEAKKINQHFKLKVTDKGTAKLYTAAILIGSLMIAYELGLGLIMIRCMI